MSTSIVSAAGVRSPRMIYGTAWKKAETERLVVLAIQEGFRGIDTACQPKHYDEAGVGAGVATSLHGSLTRADVYLQTKFTSPSGQDPSRLPYDPGAPLAEQVLQSCAASLQNLQTSYLDCLLLHSPLPTLEQTLAVWQVFESLVESRTVRQLGISNCYGPGELEALFDAARIKPAVVQNRFHALTRYDHEIRAFCKEHRLVYQSFWTLTANPHLLAHPAITTLACAYARTPAQILFRYLTQADVVPLTGTRSVGHMREDLQVFDFALADSEREAIDAIL